MMYDMKTITVPIMIRMRSCDLAFVWVVATQYYIEDATSKLEAGCHDLSSTNVLAVSDNHKMDKVKHL